MQNNNSSGGIGFCGFLAIVFIALKVSGIINWSWLWVLSPIWGGVVLWIVVVLLLFKWLG